MCVCHLELFGTILSYKYDKNLQHIFFKIERNELEIIIYNEKLRQLVKEKRGDKCGTDHLLVISRIDHRGDKDMEEKDDVK